ncbi:MAG: hypothetical protein ACT4P7_07700 [Gemmatimonadaceae bacterium]
MSRRVLAIGSVVTISLAMTTGCYSYTHVPLGEVEPGESVRMRLSAVGVDRLRSGEDSNARLLKGFAVTGKVSRLGGDSVLLAVPTTVLEANVRPRTVEHGLTVLRSEVQQVELRRLDRTRTTWASVALGVATVTVVYLVVERGGRSSGSIPNPTSPPEARIPLGIRLRFP